MKEPDASGDLPNTFGKVRTFKEDLENFGKGVPANDAPETIEIPKKPVDKPLSENIPARREPPRPAPIEPTVEPSQELAPGNPFQSIPTPPPLHATSELPAFKSSPSQSFFSERPTLTEQKPVPQNKPEPPALPKKKSKLLPVLVILLVMAIAGAGFYYYWFSLGKKLPSISSLLSKSKTPPPAENAPSAPSTASTDSQNKNLRQLVVDTSQNPVAIKDAVGKFAFDFGSSNSDGSIAEIKLLGKNNQPIGKKEFASGFGLSIPDAVLMKLSEEYSLFVTKENNSVRLGLVFKTVTLSGLDDEMKNWEPKMPTTLRSLYLVSSTAPAEPPFNSSRYKNADIRYFNFSSPTDTSLDYAVISNFLIIGTSKESERAILDYMSTK